jgi:hypothetical protein
VAQFRTALSSLRLHIVEWAGYKRRSSLFIPRRTSTVYCISRKVIWTAVISHSTCTVDVQDPHLQSLARSGCLKCLVCAKSIERSSCLAFSEYLPHNNDSMASALSDRNFNFSVSLGGFLDLGIPHSESKIRCAHVRPSGLRTNHTSDVHLEMPIPTMTSPVLHTYRTHLPVINIACRSSIVAAPRSQLYA